MCRSYPYPRCDFNSHAHVERDEAVPDVDTICTDFNSHAHVERDLDEYCETNDVGISTHTLTWSVTIKTIGGEAFANSFQLTRSRGA